MVSPQLQESSLLECSHCLLAAEGEQTSTKKAETTEKAGCSFFPGEGWRIDGVLACTSR